MFSKLWNSMKHVEDAYLKEVADKSPSIEKVDEPINSTVNTLGEPVLAIIKALEVSTDWHMPYDPRGYYKSSALKLKHNSSGLTLGFTRYSDTTNDTPIYLSHDKWVTPDESSALGEAFKVFLKDNERVQKEYQHMEAQIEREKFMDAFVRGK